MILLFNPTNERMDMQYAGRYFALNPGEKKEVEDPMGKHVLNSFGPRGLTFLKYGDNEEEVGERARQINHDFKVRQVTVYNMGNEQRKQMNLGYTPPSKQIKSYALELGIKLLEPFSVRDEERAGISEAKRENESLRKELEEMKALMREFMAAQKEPVMDETKGEVETPTTDKPAEENKPDEPKRKGNPNWWKKKEG